MRSEPGSGTRALLSTVLGFTLVALWSVALVRHEPVWLAWVDGAAGLVSVAAAFGFARGTGRVRTWMAASGLALLAAAALGMALGTAGWLGWMSLALGCATVLVGSPGRWWWGPRLAGR